MMPHNKAAAGAAFCLLLALAGCGKGKDRDVDALDKELVANAGDQTDPALASALEDQIMVDPALTQQKQSANGRPGAAQSQAPVPAVRPPLGGSAAANKGLMRAPAPG
ncbi:MAG: hypothetical protein JWM75_1200, partial [Sphingomonas bacterium]|nr:hypothetical protein [Sphingomonas bacterium]